MSNPSCYSPRYVWRLLVLWSLISPQRIEAKEPGLSFERDVAPILTKHCIRCHCKPELKGELDLTTGADLARVVAPGRPEESPFFQAISGESPQMPKNGSKLAANEVEAIRGWIESGAVWPNHVVLKSDPRQWWSFQPLSAPAVPLPGDNSRSRARTPIDSFVQAKLVENQLSSNEEANRRTLIRRLSFDLIGLPPSPEEVASFESDDAIDAYERLVDRLLSSPRYGERWARHWLDVARYGDTHGYDKDKIRPNAWPYRDYVIDAFNDDKPYSRFVREQLAGDVFFPDSAEGMVPLGFIAAGPFDWVGQIEVANGTKEKDRVRNIDRDEMVTATMNTFVSLTAQCARCHDHKFDPISQEEYYSLQAVFAALDRADRRYDRDPQIRETRERLETAKRELSIQRAELEKRIHERSGPELAKLEKQIKAFGKPSVSNQAPEFGYHSEIADKSATTKWVQVDLGKPISLTTITLSPCYDDFAGIGAGFGFPKQFRVEVSTDDSFESGKTATIFRTSDDFPATGILPQTFPVSSAPFRHIRVTATKLAERQNDFIFALAELSALDREGSNVALGAVVTSLDSIEAPVRWRKSNLTDGIAPTSSESITSSLEELTKKRDEWREKSLTPDMATELSRVEADSKSVETELNALPAPEIVFTAASRFEPIGQLVPTLGVPRPIHLLARGAEQSPVREVVAGAVQCLSECSGKFELTESHSEGARRAALANWIVDPKNSLTWRSIVNRVWRYHFGRGIVETPNDFGRMGAAPTHPELLDWMAGYFRKNGESIKSLQRQIVCSATYRQSSTSDPERSAKDGANTWMWRMNRQRLDAESIRDASLMVGGLLRLDMHGPGFRAFGFEDDHSPRYRYQEHDPDDPTSHRRSIYRFVVRSVPDPFMTTLDCADPCIGVDRRNETLTPLQSLSMLNNRFMVRMAERFAERIETTAPTLEEQLANAFLLALQRPPTEQELALLTPLARNHGLANACRLLLNTNEFVFAD